MAARPPCTTQGEPPTAAPRNNTTVVTASRQQQCLDDVRTWLARKWPIPNDGHPRLTTAEQNTVELLGGYMCRMSQDAKLLHEQGQCIAAGIFHRVLQHHPWLTGETRIIMALPGMCMAIAHKFTSDDAQLHVGDLAPSCRPWWCATQVAHSLRHHHRWTAAEIINLERFVLQVIQYKVYAPTVHDGLLTLATLLPAELVEVAHPAPATTSGALWEVFMTCVCISTTLASLPPLVQAAVVMCMGGHATQTVMCAVLAVLRQHTGMAATALQRANRAACAECRRILTDDGNTELVMLSKHHGWDIRLGRDPRVQRIIEGRPAAVSACGDEERMAHSVHTPQPQAKSTKRNI